MKMTAGASHPATANSVFTYGSGIARELENTCNQFGYTTFIYQCMQPVLCARSHLVQPHLLATTSTVPSHARTIFSPSPIHLLVRLEAEMEKKVAWMLAATARPSSVFPVPGGPKSSTPFGGARTPWRCEEDEGKWLPCAGL